MRKRRALTGCVPSETRFSFLFLQKVRLMKQNVELIVFTKIITTYRKNMHKNMALKSVILWY